MLVKLSQPPHAPARLSSRLAASSPQSRLPVTIKSRISPPKRARVDEPDRSEPGSLKNPIKKFNPFAANNMVKALSLNKKNVIPENILDHHWENKYLELSSLAVTSSTWKCHLSSFNKLKSFAKSTNTKIN